MCAAPCLNLLEVREFLTAAAKADEGRGRGQALFAHGGSAGDVEFPRSKKTQLARNWSIGSEATEPSAMPPPPMPTSNRIGAFRSG